MWNFFGLETCTFRVFWYRHNNSEDQYFEWEEYKITLLEYGLHVDESIVANESITPPPVSGGVI